MSNPAATSEKVYIHTRIEADLKARVETLLEDEENLSSFIRKAIRALCERREAKK